MYIGENKTKNLYRQQQVTFETNAQKNNEVTTAEKISTLRKNLLIIVRQTDEQRASRLELPRRSQQKRLADETEEQREVRLQRDAEQH